MTIVPFPGLPATADSADMITDDEPIVLLEEREALATIYGRSTEQMGLLERIARHCQQRLVADAEATAYLTDVSVDAPAVWQAYRVGAGDQSLYQDESQRPAMEAMGLWAKRGGACAVLAGSGVSLFTYDPRDPDVPVGVVRLRKAQNTHVFATPPAGLGCTPDVATHRRLILADNPLLVLRLAAAGVPGVVLVEHPDVLPPLVDWLAERELVVVSYRKPSLAKLQEAVSAAGLAAESYIVAQVLERSDARTLAMLDLDREALKALRDPPPALDPVLIHELHRFAQDRISDGSCNALLQRLQMEHPDLVHRFGLGYLPTDYQQALSRPARRALLGRRLGGCVVLPAFDVDGQIVDLLAVNTESRRYGGLWDEPRGLLGGRGNDLPREVIITDTLPWLGRLLQQGYQQVLMLRDPDDARLNAQRLHAAGVRVAHVRSYRQGAAIAEALVTGGIDAQVDKRKVTGDEWITTASRAAADPEPKPEPVPEPEQDPDPQPELEPVPASIEPEPSPSPQAADDGMSVVLVEFDLDQNLAIFEVGPIRYAIEVAEEDLPSRQVVARRGQACHQDRINLGVAKQCQRFAGSAARRLDTEPDRIAAHLADAWKQIQARESDARLAPAVPIDGDDRAQAEALLRDPQLLQHITDDLTAMGWIGEDATKGLLYLAAVSRLLPDPLWTVYRAASGAAPWRSLGIVAALIPPEETVVFHRLTEAVLRRTDPRSLRHRLLLVDRAETLRPEGAVALRCLREWGGIGWQQVAQAEGSNAGGILGEARGPVAVLAAAAGDLDHRCRDCFTTVTVDESPEQTARVLAAQRQQLGKGALSAEQAQRIIRRHHALQRLLQPGSVVIPFVDRIAFPQTSLRHRDEQAAFLGLIAASCLLHQHQRQRDESGLLLAEEADFHHALALAGNLLGQGGDGLSRYGRILLQRLFGAGVTEFVLSDLSGLVGDWTYYTYRATAEELVAMGYCTAQGGGQGRKRRYALAAGTAAGGPLIRLLPPDSGTDGGKPCDLSTPFEADHKVQVS